MWNKNEITRLLKINYPIIQAGMAGGPTTPELIAAVSNAGGLGTLGAGYMTPEQMRQSIEKIRELTNKPFGVNVFIPEKPEVDDEKIKQSNQLLKPIRKKLKLSDPPVISRTSTDLFLEQIKVILDYNVPVCTFTFGLPEREIIEQLKNHHITIIGTATTVKEAIIIEEEGMDIVVVQGSEAGGHRGSFATSFENSMIGTISLIPQVADHVHIPIIAAGGIMDSRGILAAMVLGAKAVQMGTAFLTCDESGANNLHKERILNSTEDETTITSAFSGKPARGIRNEFITLMKGNEHLLPDYPIQNQLTQDIRSEASKQLDSEWMSMWSGQSPRLSKKTSAHDLIKSIVWEIENFSFAELVQNN